MAGDKHMWVRVAYWLGKPKDGVEEEFVHGVNTIVIPGLHHPVMV